MAHLLKCLISFMLKLFKDMKLFEDNTALPGVLGQYYEDAKTVIGVALD